jgi:molybdopterin molybdotransferase
MIDIQEAWQLLLTDVKTLETEFVEIDALIGRRIAENIHALADLPRFDQSAVDGFALGMPHSEHSQSWKLIAIQSAGDFCDRELQAGECMRIFTGAQVPQGTWTIVMQENSELEQKYGRILKEPELGNWIQFSVSPKPRANCRYRGEEFKKGDLLLSQGTKMNPPMVGLIASFGLTQVLCYRKPRVAILATGSELRQPGEPLAPGQIFDANSYSMQAALQAMGIQAQRVVIPDDPDQHLLHISQLKEKVDLLLCSGGISVGAKDLVRESLIENGFHELFWKVKMKPGKPIWVGRYNHQYAIALPGNPVAVLTAFTLFVRPFLERWMGADLHEVHPLTQAIQGQWDLTAQGFKPQKTLSDRPNFIRVKAQSTALQIRMMQGQESHMLGGLCAANALALAMPSQVFTEGPRTENPYSETPLVFPMEWFGAT